MRNKITFASILIVSSLLCHGQGFYLGLKAGYGFALPGDYYGGTSYSTVSENHSSSGGKNSSDATSSVKPGGYGENVNFSVQGGYMFSKLIGVELNATYNYGKQIENTDNYSYKSFDSQDALSYSSISNYTYKYRYTSFNLNPALVFRLPLESKFRPYAKIGTIINLVYKLNSDGISSSKYFSGSSTTNYNGTSTEETKGSVNLGFSFALGSDYMITDKMAIFGEINYAGMIFTPSSSKSNSTTISTNTSNDNVGTSTSHYSTTYTDS